MKLLPKQCVFIINGDESQSQRDRTGHTLLIAIRLSLCILLSLCSGSSVSQGNHKNKVESYISDIYPNCKAIHLKITQDTILWNFHTLVCCPWIGGFNKTHLNVCIKTEVIVNHKFSYNINWKIELGDFSSSGQRNPFMPNIPKCIYWNAKNILVITIYL